MLTRKILKGYALAAAALIASFYFGKNYRSIIYYNDDSEIRAELYDDAVSFFTKGTDNKMPHISSDSIKYEDVDFFRTKKIDCVRFMPLRQGYDFVLTYCKDRSSGVIDITHY